MKVFFISIAIFSLSVFYTARVAYAAGTASLQFDTTSYSVPVNSTVTVNVVVNPGSDSISSTDAIITFDPTFLTATAVTPGTYFPSVNQTITAGKVSIFASVTDPAAFKTGTGTIATITFKGNAAGSSSLAFTCDATSYNTSKIVKNNVDATNIIACAQNTTAKVTVGSDTSSTAGTSPLTTPTPITQLPKSGAATDFSMYALMGIALVVVGGVVRLKFLN